MVLRVILAIITSLALVTGCGATSEPEPLTAAPSTEPTATPTATPTASQAATTPSETVSVASVPAPKATRYHLPPSPTTTPTPTAAPPAPLPAVAVPPVRSKPTATPPAPAQVTPAPLPTAAPPPPPVRSSRDALIASTAARYGFTANLGNDPRYTGGPAFATTDVSCLVWVTAITKAADVVDVLKHEYVHVLQCRAGSILGTTQGEHVADAGAALLGSKRSFHGPFTADDTAEARRLIDRMGRG